MPDFEADMQTPQWQNMPQDQQQVNISPAVGAFQQRFMGGNKGVGNTPMPTDLPIDMGGVEAGGGAAVKKGPMKSL